MQNARLDESQAGMKIAKRNINDFRYADDTTLVAGSEGTKESLDEGTTLRAPACQWASGPSMSIHEHTDTRI